MQPCILHAVRLRVEPVDCRLHPLSACFRPRAQAPSGCGPVPSAESSGSGPEQRSCGREQLQSAFSNKRCWRRLVDGIDEDREFTASKDCHLESVAYPKLFTRARPQANQAGRADRPPVARRSMAAGRRVPSAVRGATGGVHAGGVGLARWMLQTPVRVYRVAATGLSKRTSRYQPEV